MFESQEFLGEQHRKELFQEAENQRLVRAALAGRASDRDNGSPFYRLALASIGLGLISIGTPLVERHGKTSDKRVDARWSHERG